TLSSAPSLACSPLPHHGPPATRTPPPINTTAPLPFFSTIRRPRSSTLFPCTTLFRSAADEEVAEGLDDLAGGVWTGVALEQHDRSEEHTSELQSRENLVCRLLLDKNNWLSYPSSRIQRAVVRWVPRVPRSCATSRRVT